MNEQIKKAFKLFCEQYVKDLNRLENREIAKDYFYNPKYECGLQFDGQTVYIADILKAFDNTEELIKGKDEYIAKLCNDRAELKEEIKRLDSQYKNIHNTKVKVPLCNIFSGLPQHEREKIIEDIYYSHTEQVEKLQTQNMELEEKYANMDIKAERFKKFAQIVIKKNVDIFALKHAHKLHTIEQSLENYNTYKNDNEDELNQFEFGFLVGVVDEMR